MAKKNKGPRTGDGSGERKPMEYLWMVLIIVVWIALNAWILPRLGVKT